LELVVGGLVACAACEEQHELRGRVWVVGGFGDVAVYATELGKFAGRFLAGGRWAVGGAVVL
jgi:hypothetical protein